MFATLFLSVWPTLSNRVKHVDKVSVPNVQHNGQYILITKWHYKPRSYTFWWRLKKKSVTPIDTNCMLSYFEDIYVLSTSQFYDRYRFRKRDSS